MTKTPVERYSAGERRSDTESDRIAAIADRPEPNGPEEILAHLVGFSGDPPDTGYLFAPRAGL